MAANKAKSRKSKAKRGSDRKTVQIQVYMPPDLLKSVDESKEAHEKELQREMGSSLSLSRSSHVVSCLHKVMHLLSLPGSPQDWKATWSTMQRVFASAGSLEAVQAALDNYEAEQAEDEE